MRWVLSIGCLLLLFSIQAQQRNLGIPFIESFPKTVYQGAPSNWAITQDDLRVMYMANNKGMLRYNGNDWRIFPLPNRTIMRSLAVGENGYIYAGGQNEVGYFKPDKQGDWSFVSLRELIPEAARSFEDVWSIEILGDAVFFYASDKIYCYYKEQIMVFVGQRITFLAQAGEQLFLQQYGQGVFVVDTNGIHWLPGSEILQERVITDAVKIKDKVLFTTIEDGIFQLNDGKFTPFASEATNYLQEQHIKCAVALANDQFAIGTDFGGVLILDARGRVVYQIDQTDGLLSNRVLSLYVDRAQNLWLGLDNGINYLEINSPFTRVFPDGDQRGAGFAAQVHAGQLYLCTANGLYTTDWKNRYSPLTANEFQLVDNSKGQAWGLDVVDNQLFMAHHRGAFLIENQRANLVAEGTGFWNFNALKNDTNTVLAGTYSDLHFLKKENGQWQFSGKLEKLEESCRFVERDSKGNFWIAHPYKGVFRISSTDGFASAKVTQMGTEHGLPSNLHNHLFKIKDDIIFCAEHGVYLYEASTDRFILAQAYIDLFGTDVKVRRLFSTPAGNIWYVTEDELGKIEVRDNGLERKFSKVVFADLSQNLNQGFESIYAYDEDNILITNDQGFLFYHPQRVQADTTTEKIVFTTVKLTAATDSILYAGVPTEDAAEVDLQHYQDALYFEFSITDYRLSDAWEYRHQLVGEGSEWSDWSTTAYKEYTHLAPGDYNFQVEARHADGRLSETLEYAFTIQFPWYWSPISRLFYVLVMIGGVAYFIKSYEREYRNLQEVNEQVIQESQEAIEQIQEEKNRAELEYKQRELVSATMHLVQKNERLQDIKTRLATLEKQSAEPKISKEIRALVRNLQQDEVLDEGWEQFMLHFNQLHGNFSDRLKAGYPQLTPKDLKLCAYLRLNLSTKEMASLMNITVRGVEASRYRLRKKFDLPPETNLTSFLLEF